MRANPQRFCVIVTYFLPLNQKKSTAPQKNIPSERSWPRVRAPYRLTPRSGSRTYSTKNRTVAYPKRKKLASTPGIVVRDRTYNKTRKSTPPSKTASYKLEGCRSNHAGCAPGKSIPHGTVVTRPYSSPFQKFPNRPKKSARGAQRASASATSQSESPRFLTNHPSATITPMSPPWKLIPAIPVH